MTYKSKAPLRLGLAGGGTDVSPYSDLFGGAICNITLSLSAYATIQPLAQNTIQLIAADSNEEEHFDFTNELPINNQLQLLKGAYNCVQKDYGLKKGFRLSTFVEAPAGSGLGTSSTLVVAILGAFMQWLGIKLTPHQIATYAYKIERQYLQLAGGKQDQFAAAYGGINFMEFATNGQVAVRPITISKTNLLQLENNLVLYYTNSSRNSSEIIEQQMQNVVNKNAVSIEAMHQLKLQAAMMQQALQNGNIDEVGPILDFGFRYKRQMANNISNDLIENIYAAAIGAGATGGKLTGAGGGGFMIFYCPANTHNAVIDTLNNFDGQVRPFSITQNGLTSWTEQ
jgi:D-glycero-alpha-D-manno-heptose-7-phosphate kinase